MYEFTSKVILIILILLASFPSTIIIEITDTKKTWNFNIMCLFQEEGNSS